MAVIRSYKHDGVAVVILADPKRRNAISPTLSTQLQAELKRIEQDEEVHAVIVTGEGSAFCSGADRNSLRFADEDTLTAIYGAFEAVRGLTLPTIAAVNGPAIGAGFNLALACDIRVASHSALFDSRFMQIPVHPGGGHTWMLAKEVGPQTAASMCLFGSTLTGPQSAERGLSWTCVPDEELMNTCFDLCQSLASAPIELIRDVKQTLRECPNILNYEDAIAFELIRQLASIGRPEYVEKLSERQ